MKQRRSRRFVGVCLAVLSVGLLASGCDWYQDGYGSQLNGDNALDTTITPANVSTLTQKFLLSTGTAGPVSVQADVNGVLYATSYDVSSSDPAPTLFAFSANGSTGCTGSPITCTPLWTASLGASNREGSLLAVNGGVVYADGGAGLEAFDAAGQTNCSGTPTVCQPLWQASGAQVVGSAPTVSNGSVFVTSNGNVEAFDASGTTNCGGTPKTCSPLWTADVGSESIVSVSAGIAYAIASPGIVALDANGSTGCSGTPKVCTPLWTDETTYPVLSSGVAVSGTTVYVDTWEALSRTDYVGSIEAFDANGVQGCSGTPAVCAPLWQSSNVGEGGSVVGEGTVFISANYGPLAAFDAAGKKDCSGTPVVCNPLWTASGGVPDAGMAIGGSVLYATSGALVQAYDATGNDGCSGGVCNPLWSATAGTSYYSTSPVIANGTLYVGGQDSSGNGAVYAYGLP